jgi:hypothetical protein
VCQTWNRVSYNLEKRWSKAAVVLRHAGIS